MRLPWIVNRHHELPLSAVHGTRVTISLVIDQLKNISQIEHSRHRSPTNCFVNLICGLIAYCHQPKKPGLPTRVGIAACGLTRA